ncbi:hypothetical protein ACOI1C_06965 [Bacillus sp. DJP31]
MQIKTKFVSFSVNDEDLLHLSEEERNLYLDELVKKALSTTFLGEWFD